MGGVFVTGTDTGVGKTYVAVLLIRALRERGLSVGVMKPVETGCALGPDGTPTAADARALIDAAGGDVEDFERVCPYRFEAPLAPVSAARSAGGYIDLARITAAFADLNRMHDVMVVEGAGGVLAPLAGGVHMAEVAARLRLPALLVAEDRLGTINQVLLSVEALGARGVDLAGVVLDRSVAAGPSLDPDVAASNRFELGEAGIEIVADLEPGAVRLPAGGVDAILEWAVY